MRGCLLEGLGERRIDGQLASFVLIESSSCSAFEGGSWALQFLRSTRVVVIIERQGSFRRLDFLSSGLRDLLDQ